MWGLWRVIIRKKGAHFYFAQNVSIRNFLRREAAQSAHACTSLGQGSKGTFLFMTFFHWVQQFPNSHLFNDPKTLMYHQEHGDFFPKVFLPHYYFLFFAFEGFFSYQIHNFSTKLLLCSFTFLYTDCQICA